MKAYLKGQSLYFKVSNIWIKTGVKCLSGGWNQARQVIRASVPGAQLLNAALAKKKAEMSEILLRLRYENLPITRGNIDKFRKMEVARDESEAPVSALLLRYSADHSKTLRKNYTRKFKPVADHLERFRPGITASLFSLEVLQEYINYLLDLEDEDGPLMTNNTLHDHVRKIRRVMQYYGSQGINVHKDCHKFRFKYITPKPVWLSEEELSMLEKFIPFQPDQVYKDEFLFRVYSGLRFSDCLQLKPHHFIKQSGSVFIDFSAVKTSLDQNIILSSKAVAIAKKWGYQVPKLYMSDCNERIKAICRGAKIKAKTEKVRYRGNERVVDVFEKWKMVTTHVARRTFARTWLDRDGDVVKLMKYMGHSSTEQTLAYAGYETVEVNQELKRLFG